MTEHKVKNSLAIRSVQVKSPTRVDLAGGTLDMWPLYNFVEAATTVNVAIDIYTYADLEIFENQNIEIVSDDLNKTWQFKNILDFLQHNDSQLVLFQKVIEKFHQKFSTKFSQGFKLRTKSESPIGGGLGGSSSLVISIMKAFAFYCDYKFSSPHEMVQWSHNIEAEILFTPTGTQDYYPAITGGVCFLNYSTFGTEIQVLDPSKTPLEENFLLVYTGRSHHSGLNNFEVLKSSTEKNKVVLAALKEIKVIAEQTKKAISLNQWNEFPELFKKEYQARIQLTPAFTSPEIEKLNEICLQNKAEAMKICGAGGGGCVLVWVKPSHRHQVIEACETHGFKCMKTQPVKPLTETFWLK